MSLATSENRNEDTEIMKGIHFSLNSTRIWDASWGGASLDSFGLKAAGKMARVAANGPGWRVVLSYTITGAGHQHGSHRCCLRGSVGVTWLAKAGGPLRSQVSVDMARGRRLAPREPLSSYSHLMGEWHLESAQETNPTRQRQSLWRRGQEKLMVVRSDLRGCPRSCFCLSVWWP